MLPSVESSHPGTNSGRFASAAATGGRVAVRGLASPTAQGDAGFLDVLGAVRLSRFYAHNRTGEDNADAHLKRQVMGREVVGAVTAIFAAAAGT